MTTGPAQLAMVGTGNIARHHLRAFEERPDLMRLAAVCDVSADAARKVAEAAGVGPGLMRRLTRCLRRAALMALLSPRRTTFTSQWRCPA